MCRWVGDGQDDGLYAYWGRLSGGVWCEGRV